MTPRCASEGCGQPGAAWVAAVQPDEVWRTGQGFMIVRPMGSPIGGHGVPLCVDHAHHQMDLMLLRALPSPEQPR